MAWYDSVKSNKQKYLTEIQKEQRLILKDLIKQKQTYNQLLRKGYSENSLSNLFCLIPSCVKMNSRKLVSITDYGKNFYQSIK